VTSRAPKSTTIRLHHFTWSCTVQLCHRHGAPGSSGKTAGTLKFVSTELASRNTIRDETRNASHFLAWVWRLTVQILSMTRWTTLLIILATMISQISFIVAFFMPIKILFVFQGDRVPRYFPQVAREMDRNELVVYMAAISILGFVLYSVLTVAIRALTNSAVLSIVTQNGKLPLSTNFDRQMRQAYRAFSVALAGAVFALLALVVVWFLYRRVFFILLLIFASAVLLFLFAVKRNPRTREKILGGVSKILSALSTIGFLAVFVGVLADYLNDGGPNLIVALISILFARQGLSQSGSVAKSLLGLFRNRKIVDVLFFKETGPGSPPGFKTNPALDLVLNTDWEELVRLSLPAEARREVKDIESVKWSDNTPHPIIDLFTENSSIRGRQKLIIRVYPPSKAGLAYKEKILLASDFEGLPAPKLLHTTKIRDCDVFVLDITGLTQSDKPPKIVDAAIAASVQQTRLSKNFVESFRKSVPSLSSDITWGRLKPMLQIAELDRSPIPPDEVRKIVKIAKAIDSLPLELFNPDARTPHVLEDSVGNFISTQWSKWTLRPVVDYPVTPLITESESEPVTIHLSSTKDLETYVSPDHLANTYSLNRALNSGDAGKALRILRGFFGPDLSIDFEESEEP